MTNNLDFKLLEDLWQSVYQVIPKLIFGLFFIVIAWLVLKITMYLVKKSLKFTRIDHLSQKINDVPILSSALNFKPEKVILIFVKFFLILVFIIIGSDLLGLDFISQEVSKLISYLPKFFTALIIFVLGMYGASYLKKTIRSLLKAIDIGGSKVISQIVFVILVVFVSIMSLNQAGFNTDVITNNLFLILGAILAAFTISFGLGSKDIILRLLLGFYSKRNFQVGQKIIVDNQEGIITAIDSITLVVRFSNKRVVYPIKYFSNQKIEIID